MKVTNEDKKMIKALLHLVDNGSFSLKGREAIAFGLIYKWVKDLQNRFDEPEDAKKVKTNGNTSGK